MISVFDLVADILDDSACESGEIRQYSPHFRHSETRMDKGLSHNSPLSPTPDHFLNSPVERPKDISSPEIEKIRAWLFKIGEVESEHDLVLSKCRNDPQALEYYLKHARGEFDTKPALTASDSSNVKSQGKESDLDVIRSWLVSGGRPPQDYLFKLIIEKCERDPQARDDFLRYALAAKAKRESIINEKVVPLTDHDKR